jgi:hypothetical protein
VPLAVNLLVFQLPVIFYLCTASMSFNTDIGDKQETNLENGHISKNTRRPTEYRLKASNAAKVSNYSMSTGVRRPRSSTDPAAQHQQNGNLGPTRITLTCMMWALARIGQSGRRRYKPQPTQARNKSIARWTAGSRVAKVNYFLRH